ncbi:MAG: DEAD/DEAH box helicase [Elainella sp.]
MAVLHGSWLLQSADSQSTASQSSNASAASPWSGYFLIWGEVWRRIEPTDSRAEASAAASDATSDAAGDGSPESAKHPFAMDAAELLDLLRIRQQSRQLRWEVVEVPLGQPAVAGRSRKRSEPAPPTRWQTALCTLPTYLQETAAGLLRLPQHSNAATADDLFDPHGDQTAVADLTPQLQTWQVQGLRLTALEAVALLQSLPLSSVQDDSLAWIGSDLRFWSHLARWRLDLMARGKFLPELVAQDGLKLAGWQVLIDSATDQQRLEQFSRYLPTLCRTYRPSPQHQQATQQVNQQADELAPIPAHRLILGFLNSSIDAQVRLAAAQQPLPTVALPKDVALREWLQALGHDPALTAESTRLEPLAASLAQWTSPVQKRLAAFRVCFYLHPPSFGHDWTLEYFLQSVQEPAFLVSARVIWQNPVDRLDYMGRTIHAPQETLLAGLGLASRLYPVLEPSLLSAQPQICQLNPIQVYEFIKSTAWRLQDSGFGVVLPPSLANQEGWANRLGLRVQAETPKGKQRLGLQSLLNFKWELTIGGQRLTKAEFDRLVALGTPLVEINSEWVELRPQDIRAAQTFFASRKDQLALSLEDALRISTGDTQVIEKLPVLGFEASGPLQELINTLTSGNQSVEPIPPPASFRGELRPYQVRGVSWLAFLQRWGLGACLADDMGLGKTPQLIGLLLHLQEQNALELPSLLVCPTSVLGNWEREVKRFAPTLKVLVHHGDRRAQGKSFAKTVQGNHLVITSYSLVHRDLKDLQGLRWQGVVLDEAQNVKNAEAKQSQAVRQLDAEFRVALTGTPVENRLTELWAIMDFLNPGYLGPKNFFQRRFAVPIERYGDTASLRTLRSLVQPFILRRLKTDRSIIQDLPEKQEMTVFCGLSAEQASVYQHLVEQSLVDIESAEGIQRRGMILALLTKLKQVCNHPVLFNEQAFNSAEAAFRSGSGKLQRLEAMLEEVLAEGDRALIFTQFAEWGKLLQPYLESTFNREVIFLYGGSSKKQREEMIDRFQNDPQGPRIFILSLKAGGVGLNLTRANHVFHFDRWWNPAVENQATDRVFRIGQTRNVQVHKFVCTGTLEEKIHEIIESKKALSEQVVGTGENWLTELDTNALRDLLLLDRAAVIDDEAS